MEYRYMKSGQLVRVKTETTENKLHYPGADSPVYESMIDNNVWSTDAYPAGWKEIA